MAIKGSPLTKKSYLLDPLVLRSIKTSTKESLPEPMIAPVPAEATIRHLASLLRQRLLKRQNKRPSDSEPTSHARGGDALILAQLQSPLSTSAGSAIVVASEPSCCFGQPC